VDGSNESGVVFSTIKFNIKGGKYIVQFISECYVLPVGPLPFSIKPPGKSDYSGEGDWNDVIKPSTVGRRYHRKAPASAIFFNYLSWKALRVEAPAIGKEFTDHQFIGQDPEGVLYYNNIKDVDGDFTYKVTSVPTSEGVPWAWIQFFRSDAATGASQCLIEFLAEDPQGTVTAAGFDGYGVTGTWRDLKINTTTVSVSKSPKQAKILVTAPLIHKEATISITDKTLSGEAIDVEGTLYFRDINNLKGDYASYNDDRIAFYVDQHGDDFYAYFIPFVDSEQTLGIKVADSTAFTKVEWKDTA